MPLKAAAQTASPAQPLYGMWYTYLLGNSNTDPIRHEFRHNSTTGKDEMIVTRLCPGDYRAVIARAIAPIEVSGNTIRVLKSASTSEKGEGDSVCRSAIEPGVLNFSISEDGNRVTITNPGGNPDLIELARQDAASEGVLPANLFGTWLMPAHNDSNAHVQIRLVFYATGDESTGKVREITNCSKGNTSLLSQVDSAIRVTKDRITILESASHEQKDGPFSCKATITSGSLHYVVSSNGSTLTLSKAGASTITLTRESKAGLN